MDCKEYLSRFSEFMDGMTEADLSNEMEAHRSTCPGCDRYSATLETGRSLLQSLPSLDVPPDFRPRLDHRIFHLADGASIARQSLGSGATMFSVLAVAALVAFSAWAPAMSVPGSRIELPVVVVADPHPAAPAYDPARPTFPRNLSIFSTTEFREGIWGDSHDLLREYSPILERRRENALVRVGIE